MTHAATAEHDKDGWVLTGVRRDTFGERSATRQEVAREPWNSNLDAAALATGIAKPRNLSVAELSTSIAYRQRNGLDARDFGCLLEPLVLPGERAGTVPGGGAVRVWFAAQRRHGQAPVPGHPVRAGLLAAAAVLRAHGRRVEVRLPHCLCVAADRDAGGVQDCCSGASRADSGSAGPCPALPGNPPLRHPCQDHQHPGPACWIL